MGNGIFGGGEITLKITMPDGVIFELFHVKGTIYQQKTLPLDELKNTRNGS